MDVHDPGEAGPVRVMVVDDHAEVRRLIRLILEDAGPPVSLVAEAGGAQEALERLDAAEPDVGVLDARMPGVDGFEAAPLILGPRPGQRILLCSAIVDDEIRSRAAAAGIAACLSKDRFDDLPEVALELARRG